MRLAVVIALALWPTAAAACSCADFDRQYPTPQLCAAGARVIAGTIVANDSPIATEFVADMLLAERGLRLTPRRPIEVSLRVERVWRGGDVPERLLAETGWGNGDCGIHPAPGLRFLTCDDGSGDDGPPWSFCRQPLISAGPSDVELGLGAWHTPSPGGPEVPPRRERLEVVGAALIVASLFALVGAGIAREWGRSSAPLSPRWWALGLSALTTATLLPRAFDDRTELYPIGALVAVGLGFTVGPLFAFAAQLRAARFHGRAAAFLLGLIVTVLPLALVRIPLHWPWPTDASIACSIGRARYALSAPGPAGWQPERACTDLGLARMYRADGAVIFAAGTHDYWVFEYDGEVRVARVSGQYR